MSVEKPKSLNLSRNKDEVKGPKYFSVGRPNLPQHPIPSIHAPDYTPV